MEYELRFTVVDSSAVHRGVITSLARQHLLSGITQRDQRRIAQLFAVQRRAGGFDDVGQFLAGHLHRRHARSTLD